MIGPGSNARVYLACGTVDMRKGIGPPLTRNASAAKTPACAAIQTGPLPKKSAKRPRYPKIIAGHKPRTGLDLMKMASSKPGAVHLSNHLLTFRAGQSVKFDRLQFELTDVRREESPIESAPYRIPMPCTLLGRDFHL
jgi:hypothetical protein